MHSKETGISLAVARCMAEILRITAPEAPYSDEEMIEVFKVLMHHLEGLKKPSGADFGSVCELLQTVASCKCFLMLCYTDLTLLLRLMDQFFETVQSEHFESRVAEVMLLIMTDVTTELDEVPSELLQTVLARLQDQEGAPEAYQLAKHLLVRAARALEPPLSAHLSHLLDEGERRASELEENENINKNEAEKQRKELQHELFDLLFEVFVVSPDLLLHVLPALERNIVNEVSWMRRMVVDLLVRMFSLRSSKLHTENVSLLARLLDRFKDKEPSIRNVLVSWAGKMLEVHGEQMSNKSDLERHLIDRALDLDESVRLKVCQTISSLAASAPTRVDRDLLEVLARRSIDSKPKVVEAATQGLAQAYRDYSEKRGSPADQQAVFGWIPAALLKVWNTVPTAVEQVLDEVVVGEDDSTPSAAAAASAADRAHRVIKLLHSVSDEPEALTALSDLLKAKASAQKHFGALLRLAPRKKNLDASDQANFDEAVKALSRVIPKTAGGGDASEKIQAIFGQMSISSVGKAGAVLVDTRASYKDIRKAEEHLLSTFKKLAKPQSAYAAVVRRVSLACFAADIVPELFSSIVEYEAESDVESQRSLLDFLQVLSSVFPTLFEGSIKVLGELVRKRESAPAGSDLSAQRLTLLTVLANCGSVVISADANVAKALKKTLVKAVTGSSEEPRVAKQAIRAILAIFSGKDKADLVSDVVRFFLPLDLDGDNDAKLETGLMVFASIFSQARDLFEGAFDVFHTVLEELLAVAPSPSGGKEVSCRARAMARGIRFASVFAAHTAENRTDSAKALLATLSQLLQPRGVADSAGKADGAVLREACAKGMIRLAMERDLEPLIGPDVFEATAWLVASSTDPSEIKESILKKVHRHVKVLPPRFICFAALACHDSAPSVRSEGASALQAMIEFKRAWMDAMLRQSSGNVDRERLIRAFSQPEYMLPHFIHLMAHWSGFDEHNVTPLLRFVKTVLDALLRKTDHFTYLTLYTTEISRHSDASSDDDRSAQVATVCELAIKYLDEQSKARNWQDHAQPIACVIPRSLFKPKEAKETSNRASLLPLGFELPTIRGGPRPSKTPDAKKRRVSDDGDLDVSPRKKTPGTGRKSSTKKKRAKEISEEEEEEDVHELDDESSSSIEVDVEPSPARKKRVSHAPNKAKKEKVEKEEEEEEEEVAVVKKKAAKGAESPVKSPAKASPAKKKASPAKKKGGSRKQTRNDDEDDNEEPVEAAPSKVKKTAAKKGSRKTKDVEPVITNRNARRRA